MAVEETRLPYEVLVRFGEDGAPKGAHVQYRTLLKIDGVTRLDDVGDAEPLDLAGFPTSEIMTNATRDAIAAVATLTAENTALRAEIAAKDQRIAELVAALQGGAA